MQGPIPYATDPFHSLSSIPNQQLFLYIRNGAQVISSIWYLKSVSEQCKFDNFACGFAETLISKFKAIINVSFCCTRYVLLHSETKQVPFTHAHAQIVHYLVPPYETSLYHNSFFVSISLLQITTIITYQDKTETGIYFCRCTQYT